MSGLREQKRAETLEAIRAAGWALFTERGFEGTTVRAICRRAGIATGTLFNYVADKQDLLVLLFADRIEPAIERAWATLPEAHVRCQLAHIFGHFFDVYAADPKLGRVIVGNVLFLEGPSRARMDGIHDPFFVQLIGLLEAAQARGELRGDLPLLLAAQAVFSDYFMNLAAFLSGIYPSRGALDAGFEASLELRFRGLADPTPTKG